MLVMPKLEGPCRARQTEPLHFSPDSIMVLNKTCSPSSQLPTNYCLSLSVPFCRGTASAGQAV